MLVLARVAGGVRELLLCGSNLGLYYIVRSKSLEIDAINYLQIHRITQLMALANLSSIVSSQFRLEVNLRTLPPILSLASNMVTWKPFSRRTSAHLRPEIPAPTMPTWAFVEAVWSGLDLAPLEQTHPIFRNLIFC
jgi:hypothetical protein